MSEALFFFLLFAPILGALVIAFFVRRWLEREQYGSLKWLSVLLLMAAPVLMIWSLYNFGGGFGRGMVFYCTAIPAAIIVLVEMVRLLKSWRGWNRTQKQHFGLAALSTLAFISSPNLGTLVIGGACDAWNRSTAAPIISAVDTFSQQHDAYPESIDLLIPTNLDAQPTPHCFEPYDWLKTEAPSPLLAPQRHPYKLILCDTGETLLTIDRVSTASIQRYNFATGNWSAISFLDGPCSLLQ